MTTPAAQFGPTVQRLVDRLKAEHDIDVPSGAKFRRVRASENQRTAGAWSWHLWNPANPTNGDIGSQWPVSELLKAAKWDIYVDPQNDTNIIPL